MSSSSPGIPAYKTDVRFMNGEIARVAQRPLLVISVTRSLLMIHFSQFESIVRQIEYSRISFFKIIHSFINIERSARRHSGDTGPK